MAFAILLLTGLGLLPLPARAGQRGPSDSAKQQVVKVVTGNGDQTFAAEVANTPSQRARGLMFRTELAERHGMLFDFGRDQEIRMWMKNS
jgi:hypothetical protein